MRNTSRMLFKHAELVPEKDPELNEKWSVAPDAWMNLVPVWKGSNLTLMIARKLHADLLPQTHQIL